MANVYATKSGNWSDTTLWNTAALPDVIDDVFANNFTVYVDNTYRVTSIQNISAVGIAAGGRFILNNTVTLSANVIGGGANQVACIQFLSAAPATATLVGNLCAINTTFSGPRALIHNGTGTFNVYGNGLGRIKGTGNPADGYIQNQSTGTLNLFGTYFPGSQVIVDGRGVWNQTSGTINLVGVLSGGVGGEGLYNNSTGTVNITGNVFGGIGGSGATVTGASNVSTGTINILGNVIGTNSSGVTNSTTGTVNITGNIFGGSASNANGAANGSSATGLINVVGNIFGGTGSNARGIYNQGPGSVTVVGLVSGGPGSGAAGLQSDGAGNLTVFGDVFGGSGGIGVVSQAAARILIFGNVFGGTGSGCFGASITQTGYLEVNGLAVGNAFGLGSVGINSVPGIFGSQTGTTIIRGLSCGPRGQWPTAGNVFIIPQNTSTATLFTSASAAQVLFTSLSTNIVPPVSSVRQGTVYNLNDYTGTCVIPSISSVLQGVSVDNSVGIAALQPQTIWNYSILSATDVNSLGGRLANVATVQSVGQQLTALN